MTNLTPTEWASLSEHHRWYNLPDAQYHRERAAYSQAIQIVRLTFANMQKHLLFCPALLRISEAEGFLNALRCAVFRARAIHPSTDLVKELIVPLRDYIDSPDNETPFVSSFVLAQIIGVSIITDFPVWNGEYPLTDEQQQFLDTNFIPDYSTIPIESIPNFPTKILRA